MGIAQQKRITQLVSYSILIFWSLIVFFPVYWVVITSFKRPVDLAMGATYLPFVDFQPSLRVWQNLFGPQLDWFMSPLMNSVVVSFSSSIIALLIGSFAGYALARFDFGGHNDGIVLAFMAHRIFPVALFILAFLVMFRELKLLDTRTALIIVYASSAIPLIVWVMRDFFATIPVEIEESAMVDGASRVAIIFRIAMPLAMPGLAAVFVLSLIAAWNEYLIALTLTFREAVTIPLFMQRRVGNMGMISAISLVSAMPIVLAATALERYIVKGLTFGAIKG